MGLVLSDVFFLLEPGMINKGQYFLTQLIYDIRDYLLTSYRKEHKLLI